MALSEEEKRERRRISQRKYKNSEKGKEKRKEYDKLYRKKYRSSKKVKEKRKEESNAYYENHKEEIKKKLKEKYAENPKPILERCKQWKEKKPNYMKTYREEHKEEISEYTKEYSKTPIGRAHNLLSSYRANDKKHQRGECTLSSQWIIDNIFNSKKCHYCKREFNWDELGCDRIESSKPHTEDNVVPCCKECNTKKGSMSYEEFKQKMLGNKS